MKKAVIIILVVAAGLFLSSCGKKMDSQIIGTWTWTYAHNSNGDNLMDQFDYNTAIFNADGTYDFDIYSTSHAGIYTVDNDAETLCIDGAIWDITELTSSSLKITSRTEQWYEWHFEK